MLPSSPAPPHSPCLPVTLGHLSLQAPPQTGRLKINTGVDRFPPSHVWEPGEGGGEGRGVEQKYQRAPSRPPVELSRTMAATPGFFKKNSFKNSPSPSLF